jgi:hypothetical protein
MEDLFANFGHQIEDVYEGQQEAKRPRARDE